MRPEAQSLPAMNTLTRLLLAAGFSLLSVVGGCATGPATCQSICDQQGAAGCLAAGCVTQCENGRALASRAGCSAQQDTLISCIERNVCSSSTACSGEVAAVTACGVTYCTSNPSDPACVSP